MALMVSNGWRKQNMLADHHFADESGVLTEAGRMKVRWILTEAPRHHRTIYVHRDEDAEVTAARIDYVQQLAAETQPLIVRVDIKFEYFPGITQPLHSRSADG